MPGERAGITVSVCLLQAACAIMFPNLRFQVKSEFLWTWILLHLCTLSLTQVFMQKKEVYLHISWHSEGELKQGIIMGLLHKLWEYNVRALYMLLLCVVLCYYSEQVNADHHWSMSNPSPVYTRQ